MTEKRTLQAILNNFAMFFYSLPNLSTLQSGVKFKCY